MKMKVGYLLGCLLVLALIGAVFAQDMLYGDDYNWDAYEPYGTFDSVYEPYDTADAGAIVLRQSTPDDQHANFDVVGPNDYWEHFDFSDETGEEYVLDGLMPGRYSVAATDEGLELAHTVVEVRLGEVVIVNVTMGIWEEGVYESGLYDPYGNYGTYEGYEGVYPGYPYGAYAAGPYETYGEADFGALAISGLDADLGVDVVVTGPNGYSEGFEENALVEGLAPGVYAVASSGEGTDLSVTTVEIQGGQQLPLTASTVGMSAAEMDTASEMGMADTGAMAYSDLDADTDGLLSEEEFNRAVFVSYDANQDGMLDETEYNDGVNNLYGGEYELAYVDFDANADATVDESEFMGAYDNAGLFSTYDADGDGFISQEEYDANEGLF